jgi:hypothetical protein
MSAWPLAVAIRASLRKTMRAINQGNTNHALEKDKHMALIEGQFYGRAIRGSAKIIKKTNGKTVAVAEIEVTEGEHKGKRFGYDGGLDDKGIKYTRRDLTGLGWKGVTAKTLTADVDAAIDAGLTVPFEVKIASFKRPDGSLSEWSTIRSIGRTAPQYEAVDDSKLDEVDRWFAEAGDGGAANGANNNRDVPF